MKDKNQDIILKKIESMETDIKELKSGANILIKCVEEGVDFEKDIKALKDENNASRIDSIEDTLNKNLKLDIKVDELRGDQYDILIKAMKSLEDRMDKYITVEDLRRLPNPSFMLPSKIKALEDNIDELDLEIDKTNRKIEKVESKIEYIKTIPKSLSHEDDKIDIEVLELKYFELESYKEGINFVINSLKKENK